MSNAGAAWTEERVDRLKVLWAAGLSASQIATELGGVSRNAVIGKVHRLGLSGRATTAAKPRPARAPKSRLLRSPVGSIRHRGFLALASPDFQLEASEEYLEASAEVVPMARYLTLEQLEPSSCRWPIGDPASPDFRFCGAPAVPGQSYCASCARKAYQAHVRRSSMQRRRDSGLRRLT
ncbi:GcrA family cell cycle regulator [Bradyrhizobium sp. WSM3983]|uniref:GcrA family cell cycle regulator n=1 Tax=Bradyrhizobium sp. WSM3983 TaxID=1038867 RepID=UPI000A0619F2|nr:GcrA family cell cycle regulator [Bradyrhizobium sp. WSM3983]